MATNIKPLEFGDIFNYTFRILFRKYLTLCGLMAWVYVPLGLLYSYYNYLYIWEPGVFNFDYLIRTYIFLLIYAILQQVLGPLAQGGVVKVTSGFFYEEETSFGDAFRNVFQKGLWLTLVVLGLLIGVSVFLGMLLLILPGIFLAITFSMAAPAAVLEGGGAWRSLSRSWSLALKNLGRVISVYLLMHIITSIISGVVTMPVTIGLFILPMMGIESALIFVILGFLSSILGMLAAPIPVIAVTLLFLDLRMRHEGADLEYRVLALTEGENAAP